MDNTRTGALALGFLLALSPAAVAEDTCTVKAVLGGMAVTMKHCAAAVYEDQHSVTLWFSDAPFTAAEVDMFHLNSYAKDKDEAGKPRTMMHMAFCPGAGKAEASPAAVKSVEMSVSHANSSMISRQWVFKLPEEKADLTFAKLAGSIDPGGKISGRATGGKTSDEQKYSWDVTFDLALPAKSAAAGPGCGN
jgi:hypothetical protein